MPFTWNVGNERPMYHAARKAEHRPTDRLGEVIAHAFFGCSTSNTLGREASRLQFTHAAVTASHEKQRKTKKVRPKTQPRQDAMQDTQDTRNRPQPKSKAMNWCTPRNESTNEIMERTHERTNGRTNELLESTTKQTINRGTYEQTNEIVERANKNRGIHKRSRGTNQHIDRTNQMNKRNHGTNHLIKRTNYKLIRSANK